MVQADIQEKEDDKPVSEGKEEHEGVEEDLTFEELGLDPRLIRALSKKSIVNPTPIQRVAIPLILVYFTSWISVIWIARPYM